MLMGEKITLYPCRGSTSIGIQGSHIFRVGLYTDIYVTEERTIKSLGIDYSISDVGILCPLCEAHGSGKIKVNLMH
jgi:hypothetical protein